jgi:phospholipid-binding lipoprotein MlaA
VLPFFGPSTVRDGTGLAVDFLVSPFFYVEDDEAGVRWGLFALDVVDTRANLLQAENFLDAAAVDRYSFLRDSYLQRREYLIYDGNPPREAGATRQKSLRELEEEDLRDDDTSVPLRMAPRPRRP